MWYRGMPLCFPTGVCGGDAPWGRPYKGWLGFSFAFLCIISKSILFSQNVNPTVGIAVALTVSITCLFCYGAA